MHRDLKFMIHLCPKRKWYVDEFLIPKLKERGVKEEEMLLYLDDKGEGFLKSFIKSMATCADFKNDTMIIHLQDDVYPRSDFYAKCVGNKDDYDIINGYCNPVSKSKAKSGEVSVKDTWYSFPCIGISSKLSFRFINWWMVYGYHDPNYQMFIKEKKFGDAIFKDYIEKNEEGKIKCINLRPAICQNVDSWIGGSTINFMRPTFFGSDETLYFEEEIEKEYRRAVKERYKEILKEEKENNSQENSKL